MDILSTYLPRDRRDALAHGLALPDRAYGAALFGDISGFTPLTEALSLSFGPQRGAEELSHHMNQVYEGLTAGLDRFRGSVVDFSGDAMSCWFDGDDGLRAATCALAMQASIASQPALTIPGQQSLKLTMKIGIAVGPIRRFAAGDATLRIIDVLAGNTLNQTVAAEHHAGPGEVVLSPSAVAALGERVSVADWRRDDPSPQPFAVIGQLLDPAEPQPWPELAPGALTAEQLQPWVLPPVYQRLRAGKGEFVAELRPSVALFMRFSGLDYDNDPHAGERLNQAVCWIERVIARYDGSLLQITMGDKGSYVYASFGAPIAHDDDPARAVAAALELRQPPTHLGLDSASLGVAQGRVRSGSYGGSTRTYAAVGDHVNLSARLMQTAAPGQILAEAKMAPAIESRFVLQPLPPLHVKGKRSALNVFAVNGLRTTPNIRLSEPRYTTPLVGRDAELRLIDERMALAAAGRGQLIGIVAEAGMGKSRLVAEIIRRAGEKGFDGYGGDCQSYGASIAYQVWRPIWRGLFNLQDDQLPEAQAGAAVGVLGQISPEAARMTPVLAPVLGIPIPDTDATSVMDARARKGALEGLLLQALRHEASRRPLLLVVEDAHWIDSLSSDLLAAVAQAIADLPVLIALAYRPPEASTAVASPVLRASSLAHFTRIDLNELTTAEAAALIDHKIRNLFDDVALSHIASLTQRLIAQAQGNPFYIEELLGYLKDQHVEMENANALDRLELPNSLTSLILGRIDSLSDAQRQVLKVASIIGRRFLAAWLWGVYPRLGEPSSVKADLELLDRVGITPLDTPDPQLAYLFKHILVHDVAYESLTLATRQVFHEQLAGWLERTMPALSLPLDLLAFHYGRSANRLKELHYSTQAGEQATRLGAYTEAIAYLIRALELIGVVAGEQERQEQELALQLNLGAVLINTRGQASSEAKICYDRARELCHLLPQTPHLVRALFGLWAFYLFRGELDTAHELAQECYALADNPRFGDFRLQSHLVMANTLFWMGRFEPALDHTRRVDEVYVPAQHQAYIVRYAQNPRVTVLTTGVVNLWITGHPDQALATAQESLAMARKLNHDFSVVLALHALTVVYQHRGEVDQAHACADMLFDLASRRKIAFYAALGGLQQSWACFERGQRERGLDGLQSGLRALNAIGDTLLHSYYVNLYAAACLAVGRYADGLLALEPAMAGALGQQRRCFLAEMQRLKGELLLAQSPSQTADAEEWLRLALETARQQQARAFQLRTAMSLARLYLGAGRRAQAHELLQAIYDSFTEGFDTRDLRSAARLLSDLAGSATGRSPSMQKGDGHAEIETFGKD